MASCALLGPKKRAQMPIWLVKSIQSSMVPIQANLSYIVKLAIFAPSVGHQGRTSGNLPAPPPLVFPIHFGPTDHGNTIFGRFSMVKNQLVARAVGTHTLSNVAHDDSHDVLRGDPWPGF